MAKLVKDSKKNQQNLSTYTNFLVLSTLTVLLFAVFQHIFILKIPFAEIKPLMLLVPCLVGALFGYFLAKLRIFKKETDAQIILLNHQEKELQDLNKKLEMRFIDKNQRLQETEDLTQKILDSTDNIVMLTDGFETQKVNQAFFRLFTQFTDLDEFNDRHGCVCDFFETIEGAKFIDRFIDGELWVKYISRHPHEIFESRIRNNNETWIFNVRVQSLEYEGNTLYVATLSDITELVSYKNKLEASSEKLRHQLYYDNLTSLPNRNKLLLDIQSCLHPGLILIDIDSFKEINDYFSHETGDLILRKIAEKLSPVLDENNEILYRLSGDEYAILLKNKEELPELINKSEIFLNAIASENFLTPGGTEIIVYVSMGIVNPGLVKKELLLSSADLALKSAVKQHRRYVFFNESMVDRKEYEANLLLNKILNEAINKRQIQIHVQPIFNNISLNLEKFECLARIQDGAGNWILPDKFIQAAKTARLYPRITREVIRKACELFQNSAFEFSVNISVEDILNPGTLAFMYETAKNFNSPGRLCFEILESEGMEGLPEIWQFVKNVKNLGCKFAVDDFGSGYSNFDHILKLEVDYLKIDSSLVKNIYSDTNSFIIVQTIQSFADKLGIKTIAEHVHTEDVQKCIRQLGVNFSQGFFLGRPEEPAIYNL